MPWFEIYEEAATARRERIQTHGGLIAPSGAVLYPVEPIPPRLAPSPPAPILPPPDPEPIGRGLLGWIVALINTR